MPSDSAARRAEQHWHYYRSLTKRARRRVGPERAEDVVIDVFVRLLQVGELPPILEHRRWLEVLTDAVAEAGASRDRPDLLSAFSALTRDPFVIGLIEAVVFESMDARRALALLTPTEVEVLTARMRGASWAAIRRRTGLLQPKARVELQSAVHALRSPPLARLGLHAAEQVPVRRLERAISAAEATAEIGRIMAPSLSAAEREAIASILVDHEPDLHDESAAPAATRSALVKIREAVRKR